MYRVYTCSVCFIKVYFVILGIMAAKLDTFSQCFLPGKPQGLFIISMCVLLCA